MQKKYSEKVSLEVHANKKQTLEMKKTKMRLTFYMVVHEKL